MRDGSDPAAEFERRAFAKVARRLVPILCIGYVLNYMDRTTSASPR